MADAASVLAHPHGLMQQPIDGLSGIPGLLNWLRTTFPADDYDWRIYEAVCDNHPRSRADFRNANCRVLSRFDAGDYGSLDVAEPAIFHSGYFYCRGGRRPYRRYPQHVSFRRSDGCALRHQYRGGLAGQFHAGARSTLRMELFHRTSECQTLSLEIFLNRRSFVAGLSSACFLAVLSGGFASSAHRSRLKQRFRAQVDVQARIHTSWAARLVYCVYSDDLLRTKFPPAC
jgi:hypothetical protein